MESYQNLIQHLKAIIETSLPQEEAPESHDMTKKTTLSKKQQVLSAICKRGKVALVDDLPEIEKEMTAFFADNTNADYFRDYSSKDYFRFLDFRGDPEMRIVVIGDIHCDYYSLSAILLKLSVSSYDYFEKARFVFLGDYLDRGSAMFEPLLLLMDLKRILGDRMIMLRGNHELIGFNEDSQELESQVIPQDSCPILNEYCGENKAFLKAFGDYYKNLPTYVYVKVADQNILLVHAAVPRQLFLDKFSYSPKDGSIAFDAGFLYEQKALAQEKTKDDSLRTMTTILKGDLLKMRNRILYDMIWGDPSHYQERYQVAGRFQFGVTQFDAYAKKNKIARLFRSHEPVKNGFESFFDDRLFTIFSTGGSQNDQAGYGGINPAFAVIQGDGHYFIENSFIYLAEIGGMLNVVCNPFSGEILNYNTSGQCSISREFVCSEKTILEVESIFEKLKEGFYIPDEEEPEEPEEEKPAAEPEKPAVEDVAEPETAPAPTDAPQPIPDPDTNTEKS